MPAAKKTTRKTLESSESTNVETSVVPKKRASRKKVIENTSLANEVSSVANSLVVDIPKTTETMERVKSKVEMFNKGEHIGLLKNIIERYGARLDNNDPSTSTQKAFEEFKNQITENQNGVFLNLTSCSEDLWQACVQCIDMLERQHTDYDRLDKERQKAIEDIAKKV
jgi:hypothetical protein